MSVKNHILRAVATCCLCLNLSSAQAFVISFEAADFDLTPTFSNVQTFAAILRNVASAFLDPDAQKPQKTNFTELGGAYVIRRGVLTNTNLFLRSPLLHLLGKSTADLPKQRVNYRTEPKLVASSKWQGSSASAAGTSVPVIVSNSWSNISYKPDLAGVIGGLAKDPSKALASLKKLIPGKSGGGNPAV
jgi:AsmA protein